MIASNILCNSVSRFLGQAYFTDISVSGTALLASLSATGDITAGGNLYSTTGNLYLKNLLAINGQSDTWLRINANNAFTSGIYFGTSIVRTDGTLQVGSSGAYLKSNSTNTTIANLVAPTATITTGAITTLTASDVNANNVSVANNLHATHFDLQTVAQLGGSFYVSPTVKFPNSGTTLGVAKSGTTLTLTITDSSITSTTMAGIVWSANSRVKVSGTINGVVTGTMDGTVSSINTSSHVLTLSVSGENSGSVVAGTYSASQFSDLSVMVYQCRVVDGSTNNDYRVGIWMNCYDIANSSATIRVYGGTSSAPNVLLGNLTNAGLGTVNGITPSGWGLYAQNAFLWGAIVSTEGQIGGWTIGENKLFNGTDSLTSTTPGTYIGAGATAATSGIRNYKDANTFVNITGGVITAKAVDLTGKITASSGSIAGWRIEPSYLASGSATAPGANVLLLSPAGTVSSYTVAGKASSGWTITSGANFGVTKTGAIYANDAHLTGEITATSGYIGGTSGWTIASQQLSNGTLAADNSMYLATKNLGSNTTIAGRSGSDWRFTVGSNFGITNTGATYASTLVIGPSDGYHATVANSAFEVYNGTSQLASFGATAIIGDTSKNSITINNKILTIDNEGNSIFQVGDASDSNGVTTVTHKEYKVHSENGITVNYTVRSVISIKDEDDVSYTIRTYNNKFIETTQMLPAEKTYIATYTTLDFKPKYMTFGSRANNNNYGNLSATFGYNNSASGYCSVATGRNNDASGEGSIAIGINSIAQATCSAAIGLVNRAYGERSVAIGSQSTVYSTDSISIGSSNTTKGEKTIALGFNCDTYLGQNAIAIGSYASVNAQNSVAIGFGAKTNTAKTIAFGKYNDPGDYAIMVGNGTSDSSRSNALTVDWSGNLVTSGSISANGRILLHSALTSKGTTATTTSGCTYGVAGVTSGNRIYSKWYVYLDTGVTSLSDGMTIQIKIPVAGSASGCGITIDGGTSFHPVVYATSSVVTTHYGNGNILTLVYDSSGTGSVFGTVAGATATAAANITGVWRVLNMYDSNTNTLLRVWSSATNLNVPLIGSSSANSTTATWSTYTGTYRDWYGAIPNDDSLRPKMNLSTGVLTVPGGIVGNVTGDVTGNATTATTATTASNLSGFKNTTTSATAVDSATTNGIYYVNGTSDVYNQSDGAAFVQAYSASWVAQIYQDYRTGQIALRGKNNGTWQSWRKVLDSSNYTDYTVTKTGTGAIGSWGISITGSSASCTGNAATATTAGNVTGTVTVGHGGTGATSFTANSVIMSGSSTTAALTTRSITNNTSASAITASTNIITANTLAYWNGAYSGTTSRLAYCNQGAFGTMATKSASDYAALSGATFTGGISGTTGTFSDVVTAANIGNIQSASKSVAITSSNTIGATPAIGAQLTLTPGTYLLWGRFVFSTSGSGTSRNNRIAFYTGASPTDSTMLTESQVCVYTAARNWGALTTTYIVSPTANTTYTVGGTSSLPGPDGGLSVIKAIRLL